ncbi:hypothetical protein [Cellulomonas sp. URHD0024]|uniref:hypothetical protein n=1 Tax=Cellulomonas sp. URHD0024 TaxID=1302620 RepID=UPI000413867D|nr:hypothetical protein [Cellulomonas sp. URHD0024]
MTDDEADPNPGPPDSAPQAPAGPRRPAPEAVVEALASPIRATYRSLRVAIVAMALLLAISIVIEVLWGEGQRFGSISGYFYSPVRNVLVGTLVATGPALIAIKGRAGWEDSLLDIAGMVIPLVAFVPVPFDPVPGGCGDAGPCLPSDLVPAVDNNVTALLLVGAAVLAFAWRNRGRGSSAAGRAGLVVTTVVWLAFGVWFVAGHASFLLRAHYVAAVVLFACISGAAAYAARHVVEPPVGRPKGMSPESYSRAYRLISLFMSVTVVAAGVAGLVGWLRGGQQWPYTLFVVEAVLLVLFVVFWVLQTGENWDEDAVETAARYGTPPADGTS